MTRTVQVIARACQQSIPTFIFLLLFVFLFTRLSRQREDIFLVIVAVRVLFELNCDKKLIYQLQTSILLCVCGIANRFFG